MPSQHTAVIQQSGIDGCLGMTLEGLIISQLHRASAGTEVFVIRAYDFARPDFVLIAVIQDRFKPKYHFPASKPISSFERLAWAKDHEQLASGVVCDVKTGPVDKQWLDNNNADVFFVRFPAVHDCLFVIPRCRVLPLHAAYKSRRNAGVPTEQHGPISQLTPYRVPETHYPELLRVLVIGEPTGRGFRYPLSGLRIGRWEQPCRAAEDTLLVGGFDELADGNLEEQDVAEYELIGSSDDDARCGDCEEKRGGGSESAGEETQAQPGRVPLRPLSSMFSFAEESSKLSFEGVWMLYQWLKEFQPAMSLHHVITQPLAGDLIIEYEGSRYTVQHKAVDSDRGSSVAGVREAFVKHAFWHYVFWHRPSQNELRVFTRHLKQANHRTFKYDKQGADDLARFLRDTGRLVKRALREDMQGLKDEERPRRGAQDGDIEAGYEGRAQRVADSVAASFHRYVNGDPDDIGADIVCIYLNADQRHPAGDAIVLSHSWTAEQRRAFRESGMLPVSLPSIVRDGIDTPCVLLRFAWCDTSDKKLKRSRRFPLQDVYAEMPLTEQKFLLVSSEDKLCRDTLTDSILLFPSGLIEFPERVTREWEVRRRRVEAGVQTLRAVEMLLGHTQCDYVHRGTMVREFVSEASYWVTPAAALRQLRWVLDCSKVAAHEIQEAVAWVNDGTDAATLSMHYLTSFREVLQASLDVGPVLCGSHRNKTTRKEGIWQEAKARYQRQPARATLRYKSNEFVTASDDESD